MTDFDTIWHIQDEIRTVVDAAVGCGIWDLSYSEQRSAIVLELTAYLDEETASNLCGQFTVPCDYDGIGAKGRKFVFYISCDS